MKAQLQIVTYTGGRNRDGGTPGDGERIRCMASGVLRKRRSELAARLRCWRSSSVACQQPSSDDPGRSTSESSPRRSCCVTRCSTAGATPAPSAAAAQAAVWLGNTPILLSGMRSLASNWPVSLPGSVPEGSPSQRHWRALPGSRACPAVTTTRRYRKIGSLTTGSAGSRATLGPMATSASRFATSTAISSVTATPAETSMEPAKRRLNASISGLTTNSAIVDVATTRNCSGAPCAARTAAWASAPSTTICDAVASSLEPPAVSVMPAGPRLTNWSPRCCRRAVSAWDTAGSLTPSALAAAVTEPRRATRTNALSWVRVMTGPNLRPASLRLTAEQAQYGASGSRGRPRRRDRLVNSSRVPCLEGGRMQVPAYVEYEKATSVDHALALLTRFGPEARILAGGHSLIPMMKLRLAQPETLVDINGLAELSYLSVTNGRVTNGGGTNGGGTNGRVTNGGVAGGELRIGALTRHAQLLDSAVAGELFAILHDAEKVIADPIVRNWGTIGGSLCQADPSEALSAAFAALKASMVIQGPAGTRTVSAREFHTGPYETVVGPGEILTEIRISISAGGGSAYAKVGRRVGDWPIGAAGAAIWLDANAGTGAGIIASAGIGLTAVGAQHFAAPQAEEFLRGAPATEASFARAGQIAAEHCRPSSDQRGPADYKRHLASELTTRALRRAVRRARGADA